MYKKTRLLQILYIIQEHISQICVKKQPWDLYEIWRKKILKRFR